jgi:glycogen(starch) synthase
MTLTHDASSRKKKTASVVSPSVNDKVLLCEAAWEVCNQVGGIYTVVRSKAPYMMDRWGDRYCMIGPYFPDSTYVEFEESELPQPFANAVEQMRKAGFEVHAGHWLVTGRPHVVLLRPESVFQRLGEIKYQIWQRHHIDLRTYHDHLLDQVLAFGFLVEAFARALSGAMGTEHAAVMHCHEWMAASSLAEIRRTLKQVTTVFTTHATLLGRYLAMGSDTYYEWLPFVDWGAEARKYNIMPQATVEWIAAHSAHVFTTVSEVMGTECEHLLGRKPDVILPNGLNIERFVALHEFQNLHRMHKEKIGQFVMGHFFPSYSFDLDRTLFYFTSGRYEYTNKGFNLTIEALARLNWRIKQEELDRTVVFFLVTRAPYRSINSEVLRSRALMEEIHRDCEAIQKQIGERLFVAVAKGEQPRYEEMVDEYWRMRLKRDLASWRTKRLPPIVTHDLYDDANDAILKQLRTCHLFNGPDDPVKIVFHPDFITSADPLFHMDYDQFVRGCHLGVFPSLYEPWGYTPLECMALGVPAITADTAGFGAYAQNHVPNHHENGVMVVHRKRKSFHEAADELTEYMMQVARLGRRERIAQRNNVERTSEQFDWRTLGRYYDEAHTMAVKRLDGSLLASLDLSGA